MLKIRDDVDLKELEKYGFKKDKYGDLKKEYAVKSQFENTHYADLMVDTSHNTNRIGYLTSSVYCFDIELDALYDLIKDGLVEKVEDK